MNNWISAENHALLEKAGQWIDAHRDDLVRDIARVVNIRSVSGKGGEGEPYGPDCRRVLEEMLALGEELGFRTRNFEGHCGALWLHEEKETVGMWAHLDVVPEGSGWRTDPYGAVERDGYLYGRGVVDNKGQAVAALYVIKALEEAGLKLRRGLRLFVGLNEEAGMEDVTYYRTHYPCPDLSIVPDTTFPVCYAEKGVMEANFVSPAAEGRILEISGGLASNVVPDAAGAVLQASPGAMEKLRNLPKGVSAQEQGDRIVLQAKGLTKHVAMPEGGVNAIHLLTKALAESGLLEGAEQRAMELFTRVNDDFLGTGAGIRCEDAGSGFLTCVGSMIFREEGRLRLHMNIRYPVTAKGEELRQKMQAAAQPFGCALEGVEDNKPGSFPREHPLVDALTEIYNECAGDNAKPYTMGGGTYARKLPNAFAFGMEFPEEAMPPDMPEGQGQVHQPNECLHIGSLLKGMKIYCRSLVALEEMELPRQ